MVSMCALYSKDQNSNPAEFSKIVDEKNKNKQISVKLSMKKKWAEVSLFFKKYPMLVLSIRLATQKP